VHGDCGTEATAAGQRERLYYVKTVVLTGMVLAAVAYSFLCRRFFRGR
jgi:hypothetical protein